MADDRDRERRLREQLAALRDEARKNTRILKLAQAREIRLLQAESLPALFDEIVTGLGRSHDLDGVRLVLADPQHEIRHLAEREGFEAGEGGGVLFTDTLAGLAPQFTTLYRSWLGAYVAADHSLLFRNGAGIRSLALLPLRRHDQLMGALVFGSRDERRYTRHHATDFLDHLASIAGVCIENAINRARLVISGITDVLTGMNNRRYLQSRLFEELAAAQRNDRWLTCLLMDVDHFKRINDRHGHLAGDRVLRAVAERVEDTVRESDVTGRYGGEEFAMLLPATRADEARHLAERILAALRERPFGLPDGDTLTVTASIGIAEIRPEAGVTDLKAMGERLIAEADARMYRAKTEGRDRVCWESVPAGD